MRSISMNITEANTKGDISCKLTEMLTKGCRRVEVGRQLVAKPFCTKLHFLPRFLKTLQNVLVEPAQLLLQVEDPAVVEVKVEETSGGGRQVAVGGQVTHQAESLLTWEAGEEEMVFM